MFTKIILVTGATTILVLGYVGWKFTSRSSYESAEYVVEESAAEFEIRKYPDLALATTDMQIDEQGNDGLNHLNYA